MMPHTCHAVECQVRIPPRLLFCPRHWHMVPRELQRAVWDFYVPGQEVRKDPSPGYMLVQGLAVAHVAWRESRWSAEYRDSYAQAKFLRWGHLLNPEEFRKVQALVFG